MISHSKGSVWCFLFVTLFNLQGTRLIGGTFAILARSSLFVKHFFEIFFISFGALLFSGPALWNLALLFYHACRCLSRVFFENFSSSILKPLRFQRFVSDSFARLPRLSSFVKPFFRKLFSFRLLLLDARLSQPDSFARLPSPPSFVNPFLSPFSLFLFSPSSSLFLGITYGQFEKRPVQIRQLVLYCSL